MEKLKTWLQLAGIACGIIGGLYTAFTHVGTAMGSVVTMKNLEAHDAAPAAHPPLRELVARCEAKAMAAQSRVEELHADQVGLGARLVRLIAVDLERDARLRAARAAYYEDLYRSLVRKGHPVEEATLEALRSPWYTRPRK